MSASVCCIKVAGMGANESLNVGGQWWLYEYYMGADVG